MSELSGFGCTTLLTMNEEFQHASCGVEDFEFKCIVSKLVQVNPDNSRAVSALTFLLFKKTTLQKNTRQSLSQLNAWCNGSGELSLYHGYYTTITASRRLFSHNTISRGTNQPTTKLEFLQLNNNRH